MSAADLAPYIGLAVAALAALTMLNAWFSTTRMASDKEFVVCFVLLVGGLVTFFVLR